MSEPFDRRPSAFSRAYALVRPYLPGTACAVALGIVMYTSMMALYPEDMARRAQSELLEQEKEQLRRKRRNWGERIWYHGKKNLESTIDTTVNFLSNGDAPSKETPRDAPASPR